MSLLPNTAEGFADRDYWDIFFSRQKEGFEWYGEYSDLSPLLLKYMKKSDEVLIVGCGNSDLSFKLFMSGVRNQRNIDVSPIVIQQMQSRYPSLRYVLDDVTSIHSPDESYSCVLDKGTFDAIFPPPSKVDITKEAEFFKDSAKLTTLLANQLKPMRMLTQIKRVLKPSGRFICISLLQPHIAKTLFEFFHKEGWIIRVCRCFTANSEESSKSTHFPVYVCIFTKASISEAPIEFSGARDISAKPNRLSSVDELLQALKQEINTVFLQRDLKEIGFAAESASSVNLCAPDGSNRYIIWLVDILKFAKNPIHKLFAIFLVPQGRECEYIFGTHEGRKIVALQSGYARLAVVHMVRGQEYPDDETVKHEIGQNIEVVVPREISNKNLRHPILSAGDSNSSLGERKIVFSGNSAYSGNFVIEDVKCNEGKYYRRLIFLNTPYLTQSEVELVESKPSKSKSKKKNKKGAGGSSANDEDKINSQALNDDKNNVSEPKDRVRVPDPTILASAHHNIMAISFGMLKNFFKIEKDNDSYTECLIIGVGGGLLLSYLLKYIPKLKITGVEIDSMIVDVAKNYFGLPKFGENEPLRVIVDDGLNYIQSTKQKFHVVILDVDNKAITEGLSCPPPAFVEESTIESIKEILLPEGVFVLNLVCRNVELKKNIIKRIQKIFPFGYSYDCPEEVNTICFFFSKVPPGSAKNFGSSLFRSVKFLTDVVNGEEEKKGKKNESQAGGGGGKKKEDLDLELSEESIYSITKDFKLLRV